MLHPSIRRLANSKPGYSKPDWGMSRVNSSGLKASDKLTMTHQPRAGGFGLWLVTLLLCLPSLFAVFSSSALGKGGTGSSALWFIFQVSQYIGAIGIVVAAALTIMKASEGKISRVAVGLMVVSVSLAVFLQWFAVHIYRSPWF